ncbi:MAG: 16S rRNA (cytosine(1402)-N(4))-methyltransferase RsmH [Saccharofermentanales bacterium]|jgi:16S rRNA (cytosine1402-N4)-methyltransferase
MSRDCSLGHIPVLAAEVIKALKIVPEGRYVDCTAGDGGHSSLILSKLSAKGSLIALDRDCEACKATKLKLDKMKAEGNWEVVRNNFSNLKQILQVRGIESVDGILADLGVSSVQLDQQERGFSYQQDGPLDMRMDKTGGETAAQWLSRVTQSELQRVLSEYGEERYAGRISQAIIRARDSAAISTTAELAEIIVRSMPAASRREKQHPARRSFQAIRIAINNELVELEQLLDQLPGIMADRGRIAIITFHSLEDRLVKQRFRQWERPCICPPDLPICACDRESVGTIINVPNDTASVEELQNNRRARSARLRVFERRLA